jgi:hypothetical protein
MMFSCAYLHFVSAFSPDKGDAGNSLLPHKQILVKAIFSALIAMH